MEGVREEIGQEAALGIFHARNVADEAERAPFPTLPTTASRPMVFELLHKGLGADPVVAQEHHGLFAQLVGDVHHLPGQLCHPRRRWNAWKSFEFSGGHAVLVVVIALVDDEFGPEFIASLPPRTAPGYTGTRWRNNRTSPHIFPAAARRTPA